MSTQNLLPLLEQLQLMENSLTNFMFETILKLRSLTDSKVFLLLENSERRRYCGSPELVDVFEQRGLNGHSTDVRVDLDTTTDVLIERKNRKRSRDGHRDSGNGLPTGFAEPNDVASCDPAYASTEPPPTPADSASGSKKRRVAESTTTDNRKPPSQRQQSSSSSSTSRKEEQILAIKVVPEYVICEDEDNNDVSNFDPWSPQEFHVTNELVDVGGNQLPPPHPPHPLHLHTLNGSSTAFFAALPDPDLEARKLDALLAVDNPWAAYEKGSLENKLMKSVMYSVGKNIALSYPYDDLADKNATVQNYFLQQCDQFMTRCSSLMVDKNQSDDRPPVSDDVDCLKGYTVNGFIRRCIRDGFKRVASSRKSKPLQLC